MEIVEIEEKEDADGFRLVRSGPYIKLMYGHWSVMHIEKNSAGRWMLYRYKPLGDAFVTNSKGQIELGKGG